MWLKVVSRGSKHILTSFSVGNHKTNTFWQNYMVTHPFCETPNHKTITFFFYLENILKFLFVSPSLVSKQEILKVTTYLAHIFIVF